MLAVDCLVPQQVVGGIADEFSIETATGLAIMVDTDRLLMERVAKTLAEKIGVRVKLGGVEANTAILGALTTPGIETCRWRSSTVARALRTVPSFRTGSPWSTFTWREPGTW